MNIIESLKHYFDGYEDFIDTIRIRSNTAEIFHTERTRKIYDDICSLFISVSSNINIVSGRSTDNAILYGARLAKSYMTSVVLSDLQVISGIFFDVKRKVSKRRQELLNETVFPVTGTGLLSHSKFLYRFDEDLNTLKKPTFTLSDDVIPDRTGLGSINIFTYLQSNVYKSVLEYMSELKKFYDDQWMICYAMVKTDSFLREYLNNVLLVTDEHKRANFRACTRNYQMYMKMYDIYRRSGNSRKARLDIRVGSDVYAGKYSKIPEWSQIR